MPALTQDARAKIDAFMAQRGIETPSGIDLAALTPDEAARSGLDIDEIRQARRQANLAGNETLARQLDAHGFTSAFHIASMPRKQFVHEHSQSLGVDAPVAEAVHARAQRIANRTMQLFATVRGAIASPYARATTSSTVGEDAIAYFEGLPSYQDLFGSLNYCACEQCKSIFGPAAYFVDLMRITDDRITKPNAATIPAAFSLKSRRPDLWQIPLTCAATNDLVPALEIVNAVLTAAVLAALPSIESPAALHKQMATSFVYPLQLPFNNPLDHVRLLCGKVKVALCDVYSVWGAAPALVDAEQLGLSPEQTAIVKTPDTSPDTLAPFYDVTPAQLPDLSRVSLFARKTGLTIPQIQALIVQGVTTDETKAGVPQNLFVNQGLGTKVLSLTITGDDATSVIVNLNDTALDQINRLRRLAAAQGWDIPTMDWCLRAVKNGGTPAIDTAGLSGIARVARLCNAFGLSPIQAAVLLGPIKTYGGDTTVDTPSPFDVLFNDQVTVARSGGYRPSGNPLNALYVDTPLDWTPGSGASADMAAINRVALGLNQSLTSLNTLGLALYGATKVSLTVETLSALFRHGLLSRCFDLTMDQYVLFLTLNKADHKTVFEGPELDALVQSWRAMTASNVDVYTLAYSLQGLASPFVDPLYDPGNVGPWLAGMRDLVLDPTASDVGDQIAQNLAVFFNSPTTVATPCLNMALKAVPLPQGVTVWTDAFLKIDKDKAPQYLPYVQAVIARQSRWLVLAKAGRLSAALLASMQDYPAAYGLPADYGTITLKMAESVIGFAALQRRFADIRDDLIKYVKLVEASKPLAEQIAALVAATGWAAEQVEQLLAAAASGTTSLTAQISLMAAYFEQIAAFGADPTFMKMLVGLATKTAASGWNDYLNAAASCQSKISAKMGQARWAQMALDVAGELDVHLRDALLGIELKLLNAKYPDITTANNVYEFLLIDVQTGFEARLSAVKEGLNAVQLYLQRCRLRLEQGVEDIDIPPVWWEWMMDYRVWEANRRIFVYPENYLLPPLRRDQTKPFRQLSSDLQQSEITSAYVEQAYAAYLTAFTEVAALKPVQSYRCTVDDPQRGKIKALYLLARTDISPYTFYLCRQLEATPWTEWQKIDLAIDSPYVTPVYAFSRLFLFWVEVKAVSAPNIQVGATGGQTNNNVVHQAALYYSFQDHQGRWVQAQTLAADVVVLFKGQGKDAIPLASNALFANDWDLAAAPWKRLTAMRLGADNWPEGQAPEKDYERIVIGFGPYVASVPAQNSTIDTTAPSNPAAQSFVATLETRVEDHNRIVLERLSGALTLIPNWILNASLDVSFIGHNTEFLLVDPYRATTPASQLYSPNFDDLSNAVQIVSTSAPIAADNDGAMLKRINLPTTAATLSSPSFASETISTAAATAVNDVLVAVGVIKDGLVVPSAMATLNLNIALASLLQAGTIGENQLPEILETLLTHLGSPQLFTSVTGIASRVVGVGNQPGWLQLDAGPETFLLRPAPDLTGIPAFTLLDEGTLLSPPLLNANSFVLLMLTKPIDFTLAAQIFKTLTEYSIVDSHGLVNFTILEAVSLDIVLANYNLTVEQLAALNGVVYNMPTIYATDFAGARITSEQREIYKLLKQYSIIDEAQRIHLKLLTGPLLASILANLLMEGKLLPSDVSTIYRILVESPVPMSMCYWNAESAAGSVTLAGIRFQVTRLTTAAVSRLNRAFFTGGLDRLLSLDMQAIPVVPVLPFARLSPTGQIVWPEAIDGAQVDFDGLYGQYFWELYYHGPMLIANGLAANQRFSEAIAWLQYVFDPTCKEEFVTPTTFANQSGQLISSTASQEAFGLFKTNDVDGKPILEVVDSSTPDKARVNRKFAPTTSLAFLPSTFTPAQIDMIRNVLLNFRLAAPASHYWMFRPFRTHTLQSLKAMLSDSNPAVLAYENDPFNPFAIARLRIGAFEKATVMQYVDTLIDWGDSLFARGTWESITAATMLYVYAGNLLGPRPQQVGRCEDHEPATFATIETHYASGKIPVFLLDLESTLSPPTSMAGTPVPLGSHAFNDLGAYFCVPENDTLIGYWDRVEAQLYKIRHSLDINGNFRLLSLFEPPLDPLALVKAAVGSNTFLPSAPGGQPSAPPYRFQIVLSRARQLAATTCQFGAQLQAALERKDAERLDVLRNTFEGQILALTTQIQDDQISRLKHSIEALTASQAGAKAQVDHYTALIAQNLLTSEQTNLDAMAAALVFNIVASGLTTASAIAYTIPQVGSPFAMTYGGVQIGSALSAGAAVATVGSEISTYIAQRSLTMAGYERRIQDWTLGQSNAQHELDSLTSQIAAAQADLAGAQQQLFVHKRQIAQSQEIGAYLGSKFTNEALYQWLAGQLASLYYQTYRLAMQAATAAQAAYRYETDSSNTFVDFEYWDPAHAGLLAGEGLTLALDRMEGSFVELDTRRLDIERIISLASLDPVALDTFKQTGTCDFSFPELLFDYDYPGQYCRRIQSVSVSIPAIVGPYQNIKATLVQTKNYVAVSPDLDCVKWLITRQGDKPKAVWSDLNAQNQQIAISRAIDDSGVFTTGSEDLRYLPFEGTGAVSDWTLTMTKEANRVDFNQLTDVIVTLRYTALANGTLADAVKGVLAQKPLSAGYYVDIAQSYATAWQAFMRNHATPADQTLSFGYAPAWLGTLKAMKLASANLRFTFGSGVNAPGSPFVIGKLGVGAQQKVDVSLDQNGIGTLSAPAWTFAQMSEPWTIVFDLAAIRSHLPALLDGGGWIDPAKLVDIEMLLVCSVTLY